MMGRALSGTVVRMGEGGLMDVARMEGVYSVKADQCMYGLKTWGHLGEERAKKPTKFLTNALHLARRLTTICDNRHVHQHLMGGRAAAAAVSAGAL